MTTTEIIEQVKKMCEAKGLPYTHIRADHKYYTTIDPKFEVGVHYGDTCFSSSVNQTEEGIDIKSLLEKVEAQISEAAKIHQPIQIAAL